MPKSKIISTPWLSKTGEGFWVYNSVKYSLGLCCWGVDRFWAIPSKATAIQFDVSKSWFPGCTKISAGPPRITNGIPYFSLGGRRVYLFWEIRIWLSRKLGPIKAGTHFYAKLYYCE